MRPTNAANKIAEVTLAFWIAKVVATAPDRHELARRQGPGVDLQLLRSRARIRPDAGGADVLPAGREALVGQVAGAAGAVRAAHEVAETPGAGAPRACGDQGDEVVQALAGAVLGRAPYSAAIAPRSWSRA